jgi:hypothetical protein
MIVYIHERLETSTGVKVVMARLVQPTFAVDYLPVCLPVHFR